MKLGGNKTAAKSSLADTVAGGWDDEEEVENAWGNDDLIDVNADEDDWAAFESAPIAEIVAAPAQSYYVKPTPKTNGSAEVAKSIPTPVKALAPAQLNSTIPTPKVPTTPAASFDEWGDAEDTVAKPAAGSLAGLSKDEKEKEMARRREERKAVGSKIFPSW